MNEFEYPGGTITHIGLKAVANSPTRSRKDLIKIMDDIGNKIVDETAEGLVLVDKVYPTDLISFTPETDFDDMELVWKCDHCNAHSRSREAIVMHEEDYHS